mgnify:CR=1 FL=1
MNMRERVDQILKTVKEKHPALENIEVTLENRAAVIETLEQEDPPLAKKIKELLDSYIAYDFIRQDKELRMKMKDVWEQQLNQTKERMLSIIESVEL